MSPRGAHALAAAVLAGGLLMTSPASGQVAIGTASGGRGGIDTGERPFLLEVGVGATFLFSNTQYGAFNPGTGSATPPKTGEGFIWSVDIGGHLMSVDEHPGLFLTGAGALYYGPLLAGRWGARLGFDIRLFELEGGDLSMFLTPSVVLGVGLASELVAPRVRGSAVSAWREEAREVSRRTGVPRDRLDRVVLEAVDHRLDEEAGEAEDWLADADRSHRVLAAELDRLEERMRAAGARSFFVPDEEAAGLADRSDRRLSSRRALRRHARAIERALEDARREQRRAREHVGETRARREERPALLTELAREERARITDGTPAVETTAAAARPAPASYRPVSFASSPGAPR